MQAIKPSNANVELTPPEDCPVDCVSLFAIKEGLYIYSYWKPNLKEKLKILFGKNIQLCVLSKYHPPVSLDVE